VICTNILKRVVLPLRIVFPLVDSRLALKLTIRVSLRVFFSRFNGLQRHAMSRHVTPTHLTSRRPDMPMVVLSVDALGQASGRSACF
jgi:hypothetical protein